MHLFLCMALELIESDVHAGGEFILSAVTRQKHICIILSLI